jgi:hypothetical protein
MSLRAVAGTLLAPQRPRWREAARRGHFGAWCLLINEMPFARRKALREWVALAAAPGQPTACVEIGGRAT